MLGYDHDAFWDQTPHTLSLTFEVHNDRLINEHNERAWGAWHTAALQRTQRFPQLRDLIMHKQTAAVLDQQLEGLKNWVQATGGKIVYKQ